MLRILILGANGQLARNTIPFFLKHPDVHLILYMRQSDRLKNPDPGRVTILEGDVLDLKTLKSAMQGQDVVYANLAGAMEQQTKTIVSAMHATGLKRLIFISSMGIYGEVPVFFAFPAFWSEEVLVVLLVFLFWLRWSCRPAELIRHTRSIFPQEVLRSAYI